MGLLSFLYNVGIRLYGLIIRLATPFSSKAKSWITGRKNWKSEIQMISQWEEPVIWFHCASLGEFEQGRPVLEKIRRTYPNYKILLTFFSPSGYEIRKDYVQADHVMYLPLDTLDNMRYLLNHFKPHLVVIVKYELWLNWLSELRSSEIPHILISASLRPESNFLQGPLVSHYRIALEGFAQIFTQNPITTDLLQEFSTQIKVTTSADTRFDRVSDNVANWQEIGKIAEFVNKRPCWVCGSTWPEDEKVIFETFQSLYTHNQDVCLIIAPHEIHEERIDKWTETFREVSTRYSQWNIEENEKSILWIDHIGSLSKLYAYADLAYVGGAFEKGLHNILEAIAFGCPTVFGPTYDKYPEAEMSISQGGGFSIQNSNEFLQLWNKIQSDPQLKSEISRKNKDFVQSQKGASLQICQWLQEVGFLQS
ncbi:MAG: glycosyltransferase N-terminal domain-containing protein [Bacteroidota bacterium]